MNNVNHSPVRIAFALLISLLVSLQIQAKEKFIAGTDYEVLETPVATRDSNKIEVVELFWYGCNHCYTFEGIFVPWKKQLPADVDVVQMPAIWNKIMELHARAFYVSQALGKLDETHQPFFDALINRRERLFNPQAIAEFYSKFGIEKETFMKVFDSFGVDSQVTLAKSRGRSYKLRGTPEVVVNGKYRISVGMAKTQPRMLEIADYLVEKERKQLSSQQDKAKAKEAEASK